MPSVEETANVVKEPTPPPPVVEKSPSPEPEPEPVVESEDSEEEVEPEEELERVIEPEGLANVEWDNADEEFETYEYEALCVPLNRRRESEIEPPLTEAVRDAEWATMRQELRPPRILTSLVNTTGYVKGTVKLTMTIDGSGIGVTWYRDGEPLEKNARFTTAQNLGMYTLTITELSRKDEGVYSAEIKNRILTVWESCTLTVLRAPVDKGRKPFITKIRGKTMNMV